MDVCRKKHGKIGKQEVEDAIGYNQFMHESAVDFESFASPDTVCKYCGEDFKFFRALKHHMRSHSSCKNKPFLCKICNNGFSTKANCVRHVQKQHLEIEQSQVEDHIFVNEAMIEKMGGELSGSEPTSRTSSPAPSGTPQMSPHPHLLYTPPSSASISMHLPIMHASSPASSTSSYHTTSIKQEPMDMDFDQPLDFSKSSTSQPKVEVNRNNIMPFGSYDSLARDDSVADDQPMDLTVHNRTPEKITSPIPNVIKSSASASTPNKVSTLACHNSGGGSMLVEGSNSPFSLGGAGSMFPYGGAVSLLQDGGMFGSDRLSASLGGLPRPMMHPEEMMNLSASMPAMYPATASLMSGQFTSSPDYGMLRYKKEYQKFYNPVVGRLQCPYCKLLFKHGLKVCF